MSVIPHPWSLVTIPFVVGESYVVDGFEIVVASVGWNREDERALEPEFVVECVKAHRGTAGRRLFLTLYVGDKKASWQPLENFCPRGSFTPSNVVLLQYLKDNNLSW